MVLLNDLPTDSVLRRHALTERHRVLGLPPTDAVLRRHYEQLCAALQAHAIKAPTPKLTAAATLRAAPSPAPAQRPAQPLAAAPSQPTAQAGGGGLMGWLRRLLGA